MKARALAIPKRIVDFFSRGISVQRVAGGVSAFLSLFHEALQALLQGYREVTVDRETHRFEDGSSAEERVKKFRKRLNEYDFAKRLEELEEVDPKEFINNAKQRYNQR